MTEDFYYLGKITKLFGYKGEVVLYFDVDDISEYGDLDSVFVDLQGDLVPFIIEKITFVKNNSAVVKFLDVDTEADARRLVNSTLKMPIDTLPKLEGNKFYFHEVIGFEIWDKEEGRIGELKYVNDYSSQPLFEIVDGYTEYLLPIVDEFIHEVNRDEKKIIVVFPEGLLDIYRNPSEE